jgi:hypothetical protein
MLLQCEMEDRNAPAVPGIARWLDCATLETLLELNEDALALIAEQASACPGSGPLPQVAAAWAALDAPARRRAAGCLYLLLDAGFAEPERWRAALGVGDAAPRAYAPFFTVARAAPLAHSVFTYAWHLARSQAAAARLLLGMSGACLPLIARCTLRQIHALAERHPEWLTPRWPAQPAVWRALLAAAAHDDGAALERTRLHGQALLAGSVRAGRAAAMNARPASRWAARPQAREAAARRPLHP